jgi:hypothetical protein
VVSIPEREMVVWRNPDLAEQIRRGIREAHAGETLDLGDFSGFTAEDDPEE